MKIGKSILSIALMMSLAMQSNAQSIYAKKCKEYNIPQVVKDSLVAKLEGLSPNEYVSQVIQVERNKEGGFNYKFIFKLNDQNPEFSTLMLFYNGSESYRVYRYENTGNIPLDVMMAMQELCGDKEAIKMSKTINRNGYRYQTRCGGFFYTLDEDLKVIDKSPIKK